jgi:hypothetical protein
MGENAAPGVKEGASASARAAEKILGELINEFGDRRFAFRRPAISWERAGEWVDAESHGEGGLNDSPIKDVESQKRCVAIPTSYPTD